MEPLRLTPYLEECIRHLSEKGDCAADRTMACLARLQMIVDQIPSNWGAQGPGGHVPSGLYVKALEAQLQTLRKDLSQELGGNGQSRLQSPSSAG